MRRPVALFIGLRYLKASRGSGFVSFVNAASVLGITLGVAALIVVMSVMNGFEGELRGRLLGLTAHATLLPAGASASGAVSAGAPLTDYSPLVEALNGQPGVRGVAPFIQLEAMLTGPGGMAPGLLTGVDPVLESTVSAVADSMLLGQLEDLRAGSGRLVLGRALAARLGVGVGDRVSVLVPLPSTSGGTPGSRLSGFVVSGIFELGVQDHDAVRGLIHLADATALLGQSKISGLRVETDDIFSAPKTVRAAVAAAGLADDWQVRDWTQENASYFRAIHLEKLMMALLLSLIIAVAAFNIVAMLVMVVTEKRGGIAILRTLGYSTRQVMAVFLLQGTLLGWFGGVLGVVLGIGLSLNVSVLAPALESLFGFRFMPADLYYLTALPAELKIADVVAASFGVLLLTALATVYPALRAAAVQPADVLRYE